MDKDDVLDDLIEREGSTDNEMSFESFVEELIENPDLGRTAYQYLLDAIEYYGTRTVFEAGEEKTRYRFFDDPNNDGRYAVLGNTDLLNEFVKDLEIIVNSEQERVYMFHFYGPTATGKSELKRCIIEGLKGYSRTEEGTRYTVSINDSSSSDSQGMTYGDGVSQQQNWVDSPVQVNPITILPKETREELQQNTDKAILTDVDVDPFTERMLDEIGDDSVYSDTDQLVVKEYELDESTGIGVLTPDVTDGDRSAIAGGWMKQMLQKLNSIGERDPRAFSYDGVFSQGNSGVAILDDIQNIGHLQRTLLNFTEENHIKIDRETKIDIDTVPIFISNNSPMSKQDAALSSKTTPIRRRIKPYNMKYLTSITNEYILLRKELLGPIDNNDSIDISSPLFLRDVEFAPRVLEALSVLNVLTRIYDDDENEVDLIDIALLLDRGYVEKNGAELEIGDGVITDETLEKSGSIGIPVTVAVYILKTLSNDTDKQVLIPQDVLEEIEQQLSTSDSLFTKDLQSPISNYVYKVQNYIEQKQEQDVINAILHDRSATESEVREYIDELYNWSEDGAEYDALLLKNFEIKYLDVDETDYEDNEPKDKVETIRQKRIINPVNRYLWNSRNDGIEDIELSNIDVLESIIEDYNWHKVLAEYENLNPNQWHDPPESTETYQIKQKTIENMTEHYGYSEKSAEKISNLIFKNVDFTAYT